MKSFFKDTKITMTISPLIFVVSVMMFIINVFDAVRVVGESRYVITLDYLLFGLFFLFIAIKYCVRNKEEGKIAKEKTPE